MTIPRMLAVLLLAAPAAAAPHSIVVRASIRDKSYSHTVKAEVGQQTNFGSIGSMIVNAVLQQSGDAFTLQYQVEFPGPGGGSLQVQSAVLLRPGERLRAVECGDWKLDVSLDAAAKSGPPPAWNPAGPDYRLTAEAGKRRCRLVGAAGVQSNVVDKQPSTPFILNAMLAAPSGNACSLQYQFENARVQGQGEENLTLGRKQAARGGKISFLLEGPPASAPAAPEKAAAPADEPRGVPLLR